MKTIFTLILGILLVHGFAQKITVRQGNESIANGNNAAFITTIYEADVSVIEKEWKSLMKGFDAKVTMGGEIFADNAMIKGFTNPSDVYARVKNKSDREKELIVAVDLGGAFLSENHPDQFRKMENIIYDFAVRLTKDAIFAQVKEAEKSHKKLLKEQENLVDDKEQLLKDIENYKSKIASAENAILENNKLQETKKAEVANQGKVVEQIKEKLSSVK